MNMKNLVQLMDEAPKLKLKRGDLIYNAGDSPQSIYLVKRGIVGLYFNQKSGKETFLRVFPSGTIFGHRSFLAGETYHGTSIALAPTCVTHIPLKKMEDLISKDPEILYCLSHLLAQELGEAERRLSSVTSQPITKRIVETLIYLKLRYPDQKWTRKEIADYAGTTLESVARIMTTLTKNGLISKQGRDFKIENLQKLLKVY